MFCTGQYPLPNHATRQYSPCHAKNAQHLRGLTYIVKSITIKRLAFFVVGRFCVVLRRKERRKALLYVESLIAASRLLRGGRALYSLSKE